jgi:hypothetical protein
VGHRAVFQTIVSLRLKCDLFVRWLNVVRVGSYLPFVVSWPGGGAACAADPIHDEERTMAVSVTLDKLLDKAFESASIDELLDAPVSALAGVSSGDADLLASAFNIKTVRDLGANKFFRAAAALVDLQKTSG